ncbi:MAG: type IV secretion system protein VirB10 [Xanthomonadaceae bacterium]|nr:type IV secretion system protein VirB10 [Xanthomonadaceae bacterium]MDE1964035.1 type IV secretion system protein VirB10 [Xanthomonadaceae bacterium]
MSAQTPHEPGEGHGQDIPTDPRHDPAAGNPYASQYRQRTEEPDLDAGAPQLRNAELRRMNRRALLLLAAVVLLLLMVAYWMIQSAMTPRERPKAREEKVTVAEAPAAVALPQLPRPAPAPVAAAQPIPLMPPPRAPALPRTPAAQAPQEPSLVQRRIAAAEAGEAAPPTIPAALPSAGNGLPGSGESEITSAQPLTKPDTLMQRGTYIRCVLETRIISDISGYSTCLVTEPVYSFNGHTLLLPKGSKILGSYQKNQNQRRVEVVWDRIITPTGIDVNMKSPGIDNLGGAGLPGQYDAHWGSRIGAALLISMLSDAFKYEAAKHGPTTTTISNGYVTQEPFESNTARTVQNLADQAVREAANRPPTVTINQGTVIYVYVAKDVDFSGVVARF